MKIRPLSVQFRAQYKVDLSHPPTLLDDMQKLYALREELRSYDSRLEKWLLGGNTKAEAHLYEAFDDKGPAAQAVIVLEERNRRYGSPMVSRAIGFWNGREQHEGATMGLVYRQTTEPSLINFKTRIPEFLTYSNVVATVRAMVSIWSPLFVSVESVAYNPVFKDRPGVGWMLYLPRPFTIQQVPEARALIPVWKEKRQIGTIIVSLANEVYSDNETEHARVAHEIETRLVDQDMLPRYSDM